MINIYIEISKYLIIIIMALYTFCNFRYFGVADDTARDEYCRFQRRSVLLLQLISYSVIFLKTNDNRVIVLFLLSAVFTATYLKLSVLFYKNISKLLLNNMCMLLSLGMIMLTRLDIKDAMRQFVIIVISAVATWIIPLVIDKVWGLISWSFLYIGLGIVLLLAVLFTGSVTYGAKMALSFGGFSFQPAEFVKITFVFFAASMLGRSVDFKNIFITSSIAALHVLILIACRDLGTALIFFMAYVIILYIATGRKLYVFLGGGMFSLASLGAYRMFSHVRTRVEAWIDPWSDITNKGYQIAHSLFAIGTGGFAGMGLMQGMPERIPIVEKDFIFSAISEEMGAAVALCIILICLGCFLQMMTIATYMDMSFYKLVAVGLGFEYAVQVFLTIGGVTKFIPSTGVTLPFVSYGGSSIFSSFILFMTIEGLYLIKKNEDEAFGDEYDLSYDEEYGGEDDSVYESEYEADDREEI